MMINQVINKNQTSNGILNIFCGKSNSVMTGYLKKINPIRNNPNSREYRINKPHDINKPLKTIKCPNSKKLNFSQKYLSQVWK